MTRHALYALVIASPLAILALLLVAVERALDVDLPVLGVVGGVTIARQANAFVVSAFLHRGLAHRSVRWHPKLEPALRTWAWLASGSSGTDWATVHRWHHADPEGAGGAHSPARPGGTMWNVGAQIALAYDRVRDLDPVTTRFRAGLPDDRLEDFIRADQRRGQGMLGVRGVVLTTASSVALAAFVPLEALVPTALLATFATTLSVTTTAIFIVGSLGHGVGYRRFDTPDASTNVVGVDLFAWGEALHHNHHHRPGAADFAMGSGEWDPTWPVLRALHRIGLILSLQRR